MAAHSKVKSVDPDVGQTQSFRLINLLGWIDNSHMALFLKICYCLVISTKNKNKSHIIIISTVK